MCVLINTESSAAICSITVGGYKSVFVSNIYGKRIDKHFDCGHNLSHDPKLLMVLRAIGGVTIDELSETEKEIATKALECGYLRKNNCINAIITVEIKFRILFLCICNCNTRKSPFNWSNVRKVFFCKNLIDSFRKIPNGS